MQESPAQFWSDFQGNLSSLNYTRSEALRQSRFVYDAVWAAAYALHNTSELLRSGAVRNTSMTLDDFNDSQFRDEINEIILRSTRNLKFRGVSVSKCV
jgi:Tfp pilus assembly protein FimT